MEHKSFSLSEFKALDESGTFDALVAVFGNVDAGGDRIERGAFKRSLSEWEAKGRSVPVLWSHDAETVPIGVVSQAVENQDGLRVKARLFIDDNPQARAVHAAMKGGALQEFSFGYGARDYANVVEGGRKVRVLKDLHLGEVSPVFAGMNPSTRLIGVKSADLNLDTYSIDDLKDLGVKVAEVIEQRQAKALEAAELTPADEATHQEHNDNPEPNPVDEAGQEAKARIRALQAIKPEHLE